MTQPTSEGAVLKLVRCPTCSGDSIYATSNPFRPFCCERCKNLDLGAWASEQFSLPAEAPQDDDLGASPPA